MVCRILISCVIWIGFIIWGFCCSYYKQLNGFESDSFCILLSCCLWPEQQKNKHEIRLQSWSKPHTTPTLSCWLVCSLISTIPHRSFIVETHFSLRYGQKKKKKLFLLCVWTKLLIWRLSEIMIDAFEQQWSKGTLATFSCKWWLLCLTAEAEALAGIPNYICTFCRLYSRLIMSYLLFLFLSLHRLTSPSPLTHLVPRTL